MTGTLEKDVRVEMAAAAATAAAYDDDDDSSCVGRVVGADEVRRGDKNRMFEASSGSDCRIEGWPLLPRQPLV